MTPRNLKPKALGSITQPIRLSDFLFKFRKLKFVPFVYDCTSMDYTKMDG